MKLNLADLELLVNSDDISIHEIKDKLKGIVQFKEVGLDTISILNPKVEVVSKNGDILNESEANKGFIGLFNLIYRKERNRKYDLNKVKFTSATPIMAEGDSWFCYPDPRNKLEDVIHFLHKEFLLYTSALGGDWASNMAKPKNWKATLEKLKQEEFKCLLLSGGGNDILGEIKQRNSIKEVARAFNFITDYKPGMTEKDLILPEFQEAINMVEQAYRKMLTSLKSIYGNSLPVLCNTYDYPFPIVHEKDSKCGKYLGIVMKKRNITDPGLQRKIAVHFIDSHVSMLERLKIDFPFLEIIDSRDLTKSQSNWYNEIHLNSAFMNAVAARFKAKLLEIGIKPMIL